MPLSLQHAAARPSAWAPLGLRAPSRAAWQPGSLRHHCFTSQQQRRPWQHSRSLAAVAAASAGGSSPNQPSSGPQADLCPLHACLLRYGITDLAAFSKPRHLALSQEAVDADVEPKLAALRAEGLSPAQLQKLATVNNRPILACSYQDIFAPNLELLRRIAALRKPSKRKGQQQLTAAGQVLTRNAPMVARYLSCSPAAVQRQLEWLEGSLGIGLAELAGCSQLQQALTLSEAAGQAVASLLLGKGVPTARVANAFRANPSVFGRNPVVLEAKLGYLASALQVDAANALDLVLKEPTLLTVNLEGRLPQLLQYLDGYMGEDGAGHRLVLRAPVLGTCTEERAARMVSSLAVLGYQQQQIQGYISKFPLLLCLKLDSPDQRQKLEWIGKVSPWTLDDFLINPRYLGSSTRHLASRLALMRAAGLEPPASPGSLAVTSDAKFMSIMSRELEKRPGGMGSSRESLAVQGVGEWELWVEEWLQTEEGQHWGFLPEK